MAVANSYKVSMKKIVCDNYALFPDFRVLSNFEKGRVSYIPKFPHFASSRLIEGLSESHMKLLWKESKSLFSELVPK